uniref:Transcription initiation factor TFIID subunit 1 histone acetyltransferase domain-containing protein n=1 Tax=Ditylenchus dipsaci TaxID=166011 RepID=A0A915D4P8_9BILA
MDDFDDMLMVDETDELLTSTLTQPAKSTNGEEDVKPETLSEKKLKKKFLDNLTDGCSIVEHSTMALDIHPKLFPMYISPNALRHFHRAPLNKYNVGQALANFHSLNLVFENNVKSYVKEDPYLWPNGKPETLDELSAQEGNVSEDGLKNGLECENLSEFGESTLVEGSPFLGSLPLGKRLQAVENNIEHLSSKMSCPVPSWSAIPLLQVPSPGSKLACDFVKNSLNAYMYRLFHASTDNPRRLRSEDIKALSPLLRHWPDMPTIILMILSKNEEDGGEDNVTMEDEVLNAPWNTTKTFIDAMKGICSG